MAISFDEVNDYYTIADALELTFPNGDWCLGVWTRVSDLTGSAWQYLISINNYSANDSINLHLGEVGAGGQAGRWIMNLEDGAAVNPGDVISASAPGADDVWRLIIFQRNTALSRFEMWFCLADATAVLEGSVADTGFNTVDGGTWYLGARTDLHAARYYGSVAAEFFKGDFALSQAQIEQLAAGASIIELGLSPNLYLTMWEPTNPLVDQSGNGNDATQQDSPSKYTPHPIPFKLVTSGSISPLGSLNRQMGQLLSGVNNLSGVLINQAQISLSGQISSTGLLIGLRNLLYSFSGDIISSGSLNKLIGSNLSGSITPTGSLLNIPSLILSGNVTSSGTLLSLKSVLLNIMGNITSEGIVSKGVLLNQFGSSTPTGSINREPSKIFLGSISSSGTLEAVKTVLLSLAGVMSSSGIISIDISKLFTGSIHSVGNLSKYVIMTLSGQVSSGGSIINTVLKNLSGSITSSGILSSVKSTALSLVGSISAVGTLSKDISLTVLAQITSSGNLVKSSNKFFSGLITSTGTLGTLALGHVVKFRTKFNGMFKGMFKE